MAFFAGLIHDAGKLILDPYVYERKDSFDEFMADSENTFVNAEKTILGFDHSEIASEFCQKWNIPDNQSLAIKFHHYPSLSEGCQLAYILHMADFIATMAGLGANADGMRYHLEDGTMEFLNIKEEEFDGIKDDVVESVAEMLADMS